MNLGLQKKIVLVTGGSRGLGKAIAKQFMEEDAVVYICGRDADQLAEAAQDTGATGIQCDLTKASDITQLVTTIGQVDVLVTNAGGPKPGNFTDVTDDDWEHTFTLTFMSAVRLIRAVLPSMTAQHWGRIICLTSTSVKQPLDN